MDIIDETKARSQDFTLEGTNHSIDDWGHVPLAPPLWLHPCSKTIHLLPFCVAFLFACFYFHLSIGYVHRVSFHEPRV